MLLAVNFVKDSIVAEHDLSNLARQWAAITRPKSGDTAQEFDLSLNSANELCRSSWIICRDVFVDFFQIIERLIEPDYFVIHDSIRRHASSWDTVRPAAAST